MRIMEKPRDGRKLSRVKDLGAATSKGGGSRRKGKGERRKSRISRSYVKSATRTIPRCTRAATNGERVSS